MSDQDPKVVIADSMERPLKGVNNMGEFEQHPLPDQIAAAKFLAGEDVGVPGQGSSKFLGMMFRNFQPPGTV